MASRRSGEGLTVGGWRLTADGLKAGGWRLTARRQETEKGDELPPALVASRICLVCLPRRSAPD